MVYSNHFVMAVLVDGEPQREFANGVVPVPFGCEYTLRFRNKHKSRRACVEIWIDGENVSGSGYVVPANGKVDVKRHHDADRAFKFVDLDSPDAVDAGKNGPNYDKQKGVIEARFYLEKEYIPPPQPKVVEHHYHHDHHHHHPQPYPVPAPYPVYPRPPYPMWGDRSVTCSTGGMGTVPCSAGGPTLSSNSVEYSSGPIPHVSEAEYKSRTKGGPSGQSLNRSFKKQSTTLSDGYQEIAKGGTVRDQSLEAKGATMDFCDHEMERSSSFGFAAPAGGALRDGCTVEGNATGQRFHQVYMDLETDYVSVKCFLQGYDPAAQEVVRQSHGDGYRVAPKGTHEVSHKQGRINDLEAENQKLREELARMENAKLKAEIEAKKTKPKVKRNGSRKRAPKKE